MKRKKIVFWSSIALIVLLAVVIGFTTSFKSEGSLNLKKLRIGYVTQDTITVIKDQKLLEDKLGREGISLEWIEFQDEVNLYKAIEQKKVDFGKVGDAVPSFLHKGKNSPVYLAAEPSNPRAQAIAVSKVAKITDVNDLKGKKVTYTKFSNDHYFLLKMLVKSGLGTDAINDLKSIEVTPAKGMKLLQQGKIDAMIVSEPYVSQLEQLHFPLIFNGEFESNTEVYLTTKENVIERKAILDTVLKVIYEYDEFLTNNTHLASEYLFQNTKIAHGVWMNVFERQQYGVSAFFKGMITKQQEKVDFLAKQKVIDKNFDVVDYVVKEGNRSE